MMLTSCPVIVELSSDFAISFLNICFCNERVLKELWPGKSLVWCLIQKTLEERFELWAHVLWEFYRVLHNQVYKSVDTVGVERWGTLEKLIDDHTQ